MLSEDAVVLFDVDNTLLDNDRFSADLDARLREALGDAVTTVFVRQGHYAIERDADQATHPPDLRLDAIGDFAAIVPALLRNH